ncbi:unnamed protein product [Linum tenue]|uniref:beta-galactosidase n=1 Tax=Linum tenue TaxID=586396 RepID=A0AAV0JB00_9ROSI|nr:unnamed protein product [Linum tenue]
MWPDLIQKAKDGGLDVIQTYVFWNGHEPTPGNYYFNDRYDLVKFVKLVQQAGLYLNLRIGPYVCAEWNFGGLPVWLKDVPGISFRTDNEPFKAAMQKFTEKIVNMMKQEQLFEPQGGPIILSQIENEMDPVEYEIGAPAKAYAQWAAKMAVGLDTGVPWIMCKQEDAPDPVINTCNAFYCENFKPNAPYKPKMWTEAWTAWFSAWGNPVAYRPAEDLAFSIVNIKIEGNEAFLKNGDDPVLTVQSAGHFVNVFVNGKLIGSAYGSKDNPKLTFSQGVKLNVGVNKIALLSASVGLANVGPHFENYNVGVLGPVTLKGLNQGTVDMTKWKWSYKVGVQGEKLQLNTITGSSSVDWSDGTLLAEKQPLSWYKTTFDAPEGNEPLALDMISMGKGQVWINGQSIGRYWPAYKAEGNCGTCYYGGYYAEKKCLINCGQPTQRWYHVPRSWLKPSGNFMVVFEEWGGDPTGISMVKRGLTGKKYDA